MVAWGENPKRNGRKEFSDKSSISLNRRILEREAADQSEQICRNYSTFGGRICLMISPFGFQPSLWFLGFQPSLSSYNCITTKRNNIFRLPFPPPIFSNSFLYIFQWVQLEIKRPEVELEGKARQEKLCLGMTGLLSFCPLRNSYIKIFLLWIVVQFLTFKAGKIIWDMKTNSYLILHKPMLLQRTRRCNSYLGDHLIFDERKKIICKENCPFFIFHQKYFFS